MKIDNIDKKILNLLQQDGRVSASHIATELDISIPTVTDRIKKLQDSGIINGIHAVLDPKPLGLDVAVTDKDLLIRGNFSTIKEETFSDPINFLGLDNHKNFTPSSSALFTSLAEPGIFFLSLL